MQGEYKKIITRSDTTIGSAREFLSPTKHNLSNRSHRGRKLGFKRLENDFSGNGDIGGNDNAPPEWVMLVLGCLLGLATGLSVAAFNHGELVFTVQKYMFYGSLVHVIHEWVWVGIPNEGAAWLRLQNLADTWHLILLIPVCGGVIVGLMHGLLEKLGHIKQSNYFHVNEVLAPIFPVIKAVQAAVSLGSGCSLGPEGPSVDIGKSCANGCSKMMENDRERKIALVAAGAAAGIASGFNAAVAGCFFAIETVLRPLRAENSPPFTTAMIILASVVSSTVSNAVLGEKQAFTVPTYDLKSAAELPLYLILGMLCGVVSVLFTRLVAWFDMAFEVIKKKLGVPAIVCPALGGLGAGIIALKYPGTLYWGFTNVNEILHTGKHATAPGIWLVAQLAAAKVVATSICKGSGLAGGLYAPSLMIGAAVGAVFGGSAAELFKSTLPGNIVIAQPQAYALVGMAATLASVCSVPLTSVLLLFELTKDYMILLPLMGAVGLAIWVPSVANRPKEIEISDTGTGRGYSAMSPSEEEYNGFHDDAKDSELFFMEDGGNHGDIDEDTLLEDFKVSQAMSKNYVKVSPTVTLKEALRSMNDKKLHCVVVVDDEDLLEGILTFGDIQRFLSDESDDASVGISSVDDANKCPVSFICTRGINYRGRELGLLSCYPDTDLAIGKKLMEAKGIKQLPVIKRGRDSQRKRCMVAILYYDSIWNIIREEMSQRRHQQRKEDTFTEIIASSR